MVSGNDIGVSQKNCAKEHKYLCLGFPLESDLHVIVTKATGAPLQVIFGPTRSAGPFLDLWGFPLPPSLVIWLCNSLVTFPLLCIHQKWTCVIFLYSLSSAGSVDLLGWLILGDCCTVSECLLENFLLTLVDLWSKAVTHVGDAGSELFVEQTWPPAILKNNNHKLMRVVVLW